jgi:hypothetical protein
MHPAEEDGSFALAQDDKGKSVLFFVILSAAKDPSPL